MPVSTDRHSGFSVSKWELKYLRCRYKAHRNKIASAKPAIDATPPPERPHVQYKKKKALLEDRRQIRVVQENLRILDRTMNIMISPDMPTHFSKARPLLTSQQVTKKENKGKAATTLDDATLSEPEQPSELATATVGGGRKKSKYFGRPLTARLKRNTHIIFHWFIQRFGRYVPWWAEINY